MSEPLINKVSISKSSINKSSISKPMIGVLPLIDIERESYWMLPGYMKGIEQAGGIPVMLPLTSDEKCLEQLADEMDGFLFTGGQDVSPVFYAQKTSSMCGEICKELDDMENLLFRMVYNKDKPVLGICRGIQFINAVMGGSLYQDLPTEYLSNTEHHQKPPYDVPVHSVEIVEDTPLYQLLGIKELMVNSYHHQAINMLAPELSAMAFSEDGLVEAVYAPDKKFIFAVQWHPELSFEVDENSRKIFRGFILNC